MRKVCFQNFFACFVGFALAASAQSQTPGENPVAKPPDAQVQPQPSISIWDRWGIQKVSEADDWTRHFRIGAMVGLNISANFSTKGTFIIPGNNAANGIYDDGYVRVDDTGNARGYTSYWGYNNQSQLVGSTLTMHSTTQYSANGSLEESGAFPGFDMAYGGNLWNWGRTRIGWDFGFGLLPINITDNSPMLFSTTVNQTVYTFNTGTINVPGAPYQGPFSSANNPTIFSNFNSYSTTNTESIIGSHTLNVMLYTFRLGPTLYWDLNEDLGLSAGVGPAVGIVSGNLNFNETIGPIHNKGRIDATDVVYGGYVNATLLYHVEDHGDLYLGVQYMSLGNATISGGGREGRLNLGGQVYITAGINWPF